MMTVNNVSMNNTGQVNTPNVTTGAKEIKNLENQLSSKQQRLSKLSSEGDISAQEKRKERLQIEREIAELNRKLRLERLKEEQEAKQAEAQQDKKQIRKEEMFASSDSKGKTDVSGKVESKLDKQAKEEVSEARITLKNMLTAASTIDQITVTENVSRQLEGQRNVLSAEIKSDDLYGSDTASKKEELSKLYNREKLPLEVFPSQSEKNLPKEKTSSKIVIRE